MLDYANLASNLRYRDIKTILIAGDSRIWFNMDSAQAPSERYKMALYQGTKLPSELYVH